MGDVDGRLGDLIFFNDCIVIFCIRSLHGTSLGDEGRDFVLFFPQLKEMRDLLNFTLSANHGVTHLGWTQLAIAVSANSQLQNLYLDYNNIGDYGAGELSVALASSSSLEIVDLEGCGVSEKGVEILFAVIANYPTKMQELVLFEDNVSVELIGQISDCLSLKFQGSPDDWESPKKSLEDDHSNQVA